MRKEYVLAFSSFYKAMYAQEKLQQNRMSSTLKRLPPELLKSCGYALHVRTESIQELLSVLSESNIDTKGAFEIESADGKSQYRRIQ